MTKGALILGLAGGVLGLALAVAVVISSIRGGPNDHAMLASGGSAAFAATTGLICVLAYRAGKRPLVMTLGLVAAGAWHTISNPIAGLPGGILLVLAGACGLFALEERQARGTDTRADV